MAICVRLPTRCFERHINVTSSRDNDRYCRIDPSCLVDWVNDLYPAWRLFKNPWAGSFLTLDPVVDTIREHFMKLPETSEEL
ncbi:hypothetical protein ACJMK2_005644, partial [Sinanodonta woodiana]